MQKNQFVIKGLFLGLFGIIGVSSFASADCASDCATKYGVMVPAYSTCVKACPATTTTTNWYTIPSTTVNGNWVASNGPSADSCAAQWMDYAVLTNSCVKNQTKIATCVSSECQNFQGTEYTACEAKCNANPSYTTSTTTAVTKVPDAGDQSVMGITMGPTCLKNGQCGFNIYELLGFHKSSSPTLFVQDILLSASFFIGTVITIALIYSGIMFVFAGATGKDPSNAKSGIKYSIIGLLIVICSYSIIRLVQYIAKGL